MIFPTICQRANWIGLGAILALTWWVYAPGLSGGFLFDDYNNLDALGRSGAVDNWPAFWRYLTSGTADPLGRPLSLLSFLIDARDWPADPAPFLRTSLALHLVNGALLFCLIRRLGLAIEADRKLAEPIALLASGMWLLHPLLVSTTLYVVQREAMLPASFILLGLLAYTHGRSSYVASQGSEGILWMAGGIVAGTALAALCKANGALLPLLAWVLEATIFSQPQFLSVSAGAAKAMARVKVLLLVLPSLVLLAYVAHFLVDWGTHPGSRAWTIGQRALTEPRVLLDYLQLLIIPRSVSSGIFNDDYQVSIGLLHPWRTLPSLLLVSALIHFAVRFRQRTPVLAAAVLFYFTSQLLESSTIPLELYFEHRNYLASMLLFWPLARLLGTSPVSTWLRTTVAFGLLALLATTTARRAELWGHPQRLAILWTSMNPDSSRARASAAIGLVQADDPTSAIRLVVPAWRDNPPDVQLAAAYFSAACAMPGGLSRRGKQDIQVTLGKARDKELAARLLGRAIDMAASRECRGLKLKDVNHWLAASTLANDESLLGELALAEGLPKQALAHFNRDFAAKLRPDVAAKHAARLASHGYFEHALSHLERYESLRSSLRSPRYGMPYIHALILQRQGYWAREMNWLRAKFRAGIAARRNLDGKE